MRLSSPIPFATTCTSAPTRSHRLAISLMKPIFTARNAFEAYLIISADSTSVIDHRRFDQVERTVDLAHDRGGALAGRADDDAVGSHEIADRRPLAQKLRIRDDIEVDAASAQRCSKVAREPRAGADRHRALRDDHPVAVEVRRRCRRRRWRSATDRPRRCRLRRADGDEDDGGGAHGVCRDSVVNRRRPAAALRDTTSPSPGS